MISVKQTMLGLLSLTMQQVETPQQVGVQSAESNDLPRLGEDLKSPLYSHEIKKADADFPVYVVRYTQSSLYGNVDIRLLIADNGDNILTQGDDILGAQYNVDRSALEGTQELGDTFNDKCPIRITRTYNKNKEIISRDIKQDNHILHVIERSKELLMLQGYENAIFNDHKKLKLD
jgi:hypothetical protein